MTTTTITPRLDTNGILNAARQDYAVGKKGALRSLIWFAYGYHQAHEAGTKEAVQFLNDVRAILKAEGAVKSEQSTKAKIVKAVGTNFRALFGPELVSQYESDAHRVQAMFIAAQASRAITVARLYDLAQHGCADYSDRMKQEKADEKLAQREAEMLAHDAAVLEMPLSQIEPMGFDNVVYALETQAPEVAANTINKMFAPMLDSEIETLMAQCSEELAKRAATATATDVAKVA